MYKTLLESLLTEGYNRNKTWDAVKGKAFTAIKDRYFRNKEQHAAEHGVDSAEKTFSTSKEEFTPANFEKSGVKEHLLDIAEKQSRLHGMKTKYLPMTINMALSTGKHNDFEYDHQNIVGRMNRYHSIVEKHSGTMPEEHKNWKAFEQPSDIDRVTEDPRYSKDHFTVVHEDENTRAIAIKTKEGMSRIRSKDGVIASWCNSAQSEGGKKHFENYAKAGRSYVVQIKHGTPGEQYQIHFQRDELQGHAHQDLGMQGDGSVIESKKSLIEKHSPGLIEKLRTIEARHTIGTMNGPTGTRKVQEAVSFNPSFVRKLHDEAHSMNLPSSHPVFSLKGTQNDEPRPVVIEGIHEPSFVYEDFINLILEAAKGAEFDAEMRSKYGTEIEKRLSQPLALRKNTPERSGLNIFTSDVNTNPNYDYASMLKQYKNNPSKMEAFHDDGHVSADIFSGAHRDFKNFDMHTPLKDTKEFKEITHSPLTRAVPLEKGHTGFVYETSRGPISVSPKESEMSPHDYAHHKLLKDLKMTLPHPRYVEPALKMFTAREGEHNYQAGGIHSSEDLFSTAVDTFKQYHFLHSKGLLDKDARTSGAKTFAPNPELWQHYSKNHPLHTDLDSFTNFRHLRNVVNDPMYKQHLNPAPKISDLKAGHDYDVVHDDEGSTVYHVKTQKASHTLSFCPHTGNHTSWCTGVKDSNMFTHYNEQGPILAIHPKNPEHNGEMYQVHTASDQWMDENDQNLDVSKGGYPKTGRGHGLRSSLGITPEKIKNWSHGEMVRNAENYPEARLGENHDLQHYILQHGTNHSVIRAQGHDPDELHQHLPMIIDRTSSDEHAERASAQLDHIVSKHNHDGIGPKTVNSIASYASGYHVDPLVDNHFEKLNFFDKATIRSRVTDGHIGLSGSNIRKIGM